MIRTRLWSSLALALAATSVVSGPAGAVTTRSFVTDSYKDLDEGEAEHALISSLGEVSPGQGTERVDLGSDAAWAAVRGPDGTLYVGDVSGGEIWAVSGGKKRRLATLAPETPWIGALAIHGGTLYAGTLGSGAIHAVDVKTGKSSRLVELAGADHVWALAFDAAGKTLYVATGPDGKLFAVDVAKKSARVVWTADEKHLLSLLRARDGALWVGTSDEGVLYRVDPQNGQARAIADFAGDEVKAIVETEGAFVVAVNEFETKPGSPPTPAPPSGPKGTAAKAPEAGSGPGSDKSTSRTGDRKGKGALFRVEPDGRTEQLHSLAEGYFQDLAVGPGGEVYAAAGTQGRIYELRPDRTVVTAFDTPERQVNAVLVDGGQLAFVTGDSAAVYRATGPTKDARYVSKVFDASFPSRWGNVRLRASGPVTLETRSGNTAKPGRGWSAWQRPASPASGGGDETLARVVSPPGRYLQYRLSWDGSAGSLKSSSARSVTLYYLPQNQRPRITEITPGEGGDSRGNPVTLASGATKPRSPILKLKWKVDNTDDDDLAFAVEYRAEGDVEWQAVPSGEAGPLTRTELEWNTESIPDGYYRLRVTASDDRANPADLALTNAKLSSPFLIDNGRPTLPSLEVKSGWASGQAMDGFSRVDELAWSIDGGDFAVAFPKDGIFDDRSETFTFRLPAGLRPGTHTLTVRAADEANNITARSTTFRVAK